MAVSSQLLFNQLALTPGTQTTPSIGVATGATWYSLIYGIDLMTDPATFLKITLQISVDSGATWTNFGGSGAPGGVFFFKNTSIVRTQAALSASMLPNPELTPTQRRMRAIVTATGSFTVGPGTLYHGVDGEHPPAVI